MLNLLSEEAIAPEKMNHDRKMASGETAHRRRRRGTQKLSGKRTDSGRYSEKVGHPPVHRRCNLSLHGGRESLRLLNGGTKLHRQLCVLFCCLKM